MNVLGREIEAFLLENFPNPRSRTKLAYSVAFGIFVWLFWEYVETFAFPFDAWVFYVIANPLLPLVGSQFSPHPVGFSIERELKVIFFFPGFLSGLTISIAIVRGVADLWKTIVPAAVGMLLGGPLLVVLGVGPMLVLVPLIASCIYSLFGGILGLVLMGGLSARRSSVLPLLVLFIVQPQDAWSWEHNTGHRNITVQAKAVLKRAEPDKYSELERFMPEIHNGSADEDTIHALDFLGLRGTIHFYNPRTNLGLVVRSPGSPNGAPASQSAITTARNQEDRAGLVDAEIARQADRRDFLEGRDESDALGRRRAGVLVFEGQFQDDRFARLDEFLGARGAAKPKQGGGKNTDGEPSKIQTTASTAAEKQPSPWPETVEAARSHGLASTWPTSSAGFARWADARATRSALRPRHSAPMREPGAAARPALSVSPEPFTSARSGPPSVSTQPSWAARRPLSAASWHGQPEPPLPDRLWSSSVPPAVFNGVRLLTRVAPAAVDGRARRSAASGAANRGVPW